MPVTSVTKELLDVSALPRQQGRSTEGVLHGCYAPLEGDALIAQFEQLCLARERVLEKAVRQRPKQYDMKRNHYVRASFLEHRSALELLRASGRDAQHAVLTVPLHARNTQPPPPS